MLAIMMMKERKRSDAYRKRRTGFGRKKKEKVFWGASRQVSKSIAEPQKPIFL